jgi:hypothetical protein
MNSDIFKVNTMQQTIKNKTSELLAALPDEHLYYTPSDFQEAGFPAYLVDRIHLEIERNLADSVTLPESDWADMRADQVMDAWNHFLNAIRTENRVPASYARTVIEGAIEEVLDLLTQPRSYIIEALFGREPSASYAQITYRKRFVVAYPILTEALLRYMHRKGLEEITREKATYVINTVDDQLSNTFTPLKWAQHLDPVFTLLDNEVPSVLLTRYFVDRGMMLEAKWIDKGLDVYSRSTFIERMSTTSLIDEADSNEQPDTLTDAFTTEPSNAGGTVAEVQTPSTNSLILDEDQAFTPVFEPNPSTVPPAVTPSDLQQPEEEVTLAHAFGSIEDEESPFDLQETEEEVTLAHAFGSIEDEESPFDLQETEEEVTLAHAFGSIEDEESPFDQQQPEEEVTLAHAFGSTEDDEPPFDLQEPEDEPALIDASSDDEHVIYLTDRAKKLLSLFEPHLETFIVDIFLNDELEFYKHLENIAAYDQWRMAGRYITRDIFDKNRIDLYSEHAVLFTDTVQEFFEQVEN